MTQLLSALQKVLNLASNNFLLHSSAEHVRIQHASCLKFYYDDKFIYVRVVHVFITLPLVVQVFCCACFTWISIFRIDTSQGPFLSLVNKKWPVAVMVLCFPYSLRESMLITLPPLILFSKIWKLRL